MFLSRFFRFWPQNCEPSLSQELLHYGFQSLTAWRHVFLFIVLIVQCQHGLELIRLTYPFFVQALQNCPTERPRSTSGLRPIPYPSLGHHFFDCGMMGCAVHVKQNKDLTIACHEFDTLGEHDKEQKTKQARATNVTRASGHCQVLKTRRRGEGQQELTSRDVSF